MEEPGTRNLSRKVISVAAGEAHTLALTGDGCVYAWGRGMFERLGTGSDADELFPVKLKFGSEENSLKIAGVAAGAYHSLVLADDGSVWSWGYNAYGQLGINGENYAVPHLLEKFIDLKSSDALNNELETKNEPPLKVCYVKAGGMMSLAIDNLGALWIWGNFPQTNSKAEDGFSLISSSTPTPVWDFFGHTVVKVACGNEHVVALVSAGETYKNEDLICYSWGSNNHGQLGLGDEESRKTPQIIQTFNQESPDLVYEIACGAFHTALLTCKKKPNDKLETILWTFGLGENGQLGHGTVQGKLSPKPVNELPNSIYLLSVACGLFHTSVVSSTGDVWSWGMERGLGLCPGATFAGGDSGDAISPRHILPNELHGLKFPNPVQIACGAAHTILVADDGYKLWSWGRGRSGVLGNGKTIDSFAPTVVLWPPLTEDFKKDEIKNASSEEEKTDAKDSKGDPETDKKLSSMMEEMKLLQERAHTMELYISILHGSIFGKPFEERDIPASLRITGSFNVAREWEDMLESADRDRLLRLEMFYRNMLAGVKDKLLKRRIQELIKESLHSATSGY